MISVMRTTSGTAGARGHGRVTGMRWLRRALRPVAGLVIAAGIAAAGAPRLAAQAGAAASPGAGASPAAAAPTAVTPTVLTHPDYKVQMAVGAVDVPRGSMLIRDIDSVWTAAGTVLAHADILIRDGVIRDIGSGLPAPAGVKVVDGRGYTAMPGFVDPHSHIAMVTSNECTSPVVPEVRVIDQLDPDDFGIFRALTGGVTTAHVMHGSCNPIGGQSAIIKPRWGLKDPAQFMLQGAPQIVKFALGENVTRKGWAGEGVRRYPWSRQGVEAIYVQAFDAARAYQAEWDRYRRDPKSFRVPPRRDLRLEALSEILQGKIRVQAHAYRADEILMLMNVAERFGFTIDGFVHVLEGYKVADEMAAHGAYATTFSDWWHYKLEAIDAIPYNAAILWNHGVHTSLHSDSEELQSLAIYEIQKPVKYGGVPKEEALRMYTLYPAQQLMIADKVGSLEKGKQGDVVLLDGDPFDSHTSVRMTIMDGRVYWDAAHEADYRHFPMRPLPVPTRAAAAAQPVPWAATRKLVDDEALAGGAARADVAAAREAGADHGPSSGVGESAAASGSFALVGATVHTGDGRTIENGVVVVRDGRIAAVGPAGEVEVPAGAERIDVAGKELFPGLIDLDTELGLQSIGSVPTATDQREVGKFNPHLRAMVGMQPHSTTFGVARANGVTTAVTHMSGSIIPGAGSLIQLKGDTPTRMSILDRAALFVEFPRPEGEEWDEPKLEGDDLEALVALFERAELFAEEPTTAEAADRPFEAQVHGGDRAMLEALVPVVRGEMPVIFEASREREIRSLLLFLDRFPDVRAAILGGDGAHHVAGELAERRIPVILTSGNGVTRDRDESYAAAWANAAVLNDAGVPVAVATGGVDAVRNLPYFAARHWAYGLPHDVALRAITSTPAEILGLGGEIGSIAPGRRADLVLTDGDILEITTDIERMWVGGEEVDPRDNRQYELYQSFLNRH